MASFGIYTLANDVVYDQLVALLNSIEVNVSADIPICIIPYDEQLDRVQQEISSRKNVTLYENRASIQRWDNFAAQVWANHPEIKQKTFNPWYKSPLLRKLCVFDGSFDKFVFYDADSLAMKPLDNLLEKLETYDFIFDDWEHKKSTKNAALNLEIIQQSGLYQIKEVRKKLHCSSFFGSKKGIFSSSEIEYLQNLLIDQGEIEWIPRCWDDAFLFSYMTLRCNRQLFNFTLSPNGQEKTGNCANADPFVNIDNVLYNQDGLKPIHRIHYMGYSSRDFANLCKGEEVNIPYQHEFLYYRFLKQPELRPKQLTPPSIIKKTNRILDKVATKIKKVKF